jgi:RHS repeat-associated protein
VYDAKERLCMTVEPETGATVQDYDASNNLLWRATGLDPSKTSCGITTTDIEARKTSFTYDFQNRPSATSYADGSAGITRTYTADGLPLTITSGTAALGFSTWTNTYNKRRLKERESLAYGNVTYNIDTKYDANGSLLQLTYPDATVVGYNPNALGQARQIGTYATGISYHPNGAIASFSYGNGITHSLTQNTRGLPLQAVDGGVISDLYSFDENANVAGIGDQIAGNVNSRTMTYDYLDRLKTVAAPNLWGTASYSYDTLDNLTASKISTGGTTRDMIHVFDTATNRLTNNIGNAGYNYSYGYDVQGNIVSRGGKTYVFDQANRMKSSMGATYVYDGLGHRVSVVGTDGVNRIHVYSQEGKLLYVVPGTGTATKYVYLHNHVLAEVTGASAIYAHTDGLGSPVAQTSSAGAVLNRTRYEPFGYVATGTPRKIGFTGHVNDAETGLIYMQQRYYDPIAGRMLSIDPVVTDANTGNSFNRYAYANNSPYRYVDADGRDAMDWVHGGLTVASFCPSICGSAFSAADGMVSLAQGDRVGAGIAFGAAAVGIVSDAGAVKVAAMAVKEAAGTTKVAGATANVAKEAGAAGKVFSKEKQALVDMAKADKKAGITSADMKAYKDLNAKLPDPFPTNKVRGPEAHSSGAPSSQAPHGHVGPVDHIPVKD